MENNQTGLTRKNKPGQGRKVGTGKFKEPTTIVRIPETQVHVIKDFLAAYQRKKLVENLDVVTKFESPDFNALPLYIPLYSSKVSAGLPSSAEEHIEKRLDPNDFLIDEKDATFFVTINGYSMIDAGLLPGDKVVVDKSKVAKVGNIVVALVNNEYTIKLLSRNTKTGRFRLDPANSTGAYSPIEITEDMHFEVWGVVTGSFRRF
jgi:DNA polymerase V